jgi:hypothetical protein
VGDGFDAVDFTGFDQRSDAALGDAALIVTDEEVVLPAQGHHPFILPMSARNGKSIIAGTLILA